jgi:hypothetical protein
MKVVVDYKKIVDRLSDLYFYRHLQQSVEDESKKDNFLFLWSHIMSSILDQDYPSFRYDSLQLIVHQEVMVLNIKIDNNRDIFLFLT